MFEWTGLLDQATDHGECPPDETLEAMQPWSSYAPDGLLAMLLDSQSCDAGLFEQVERIAAWDKIVAWAQARQVREMASFTKGCVAIAGADAAARAGARTAGEPVPPQIAYADGEEQAAAQVALALRISPGSASHRLAEALTLTERYPAALDALEAGAVTSTKVRIIAEQTAQLSDEQAAAVTRQVLPKAEAQPPSLLRRAVRRAVARTDADALRRRHLAAAAERGVWLYELPDGMAMLSARIPAAEAVGAYAVLDEHARTARGDERTLDARRADALVDLICGPLGHPAAGSRGTFRWRDNVGVQMRVTVPFSTLFGIDEQPAELAGYGPITPDQARELAAVGTWRRVLTDPPTGLPVDYGTTTYRPPPALRDAILTKHPLCQAPGCTRAAIGCDLDHHTPFHRSQNTSLHDTGPYCRRHHRLKVTPRWRVTREADGSVTWTTPTGHSYRSTPPPVAEPVPGSSRADPDEPPPF